MIASLQGTIASVQDDMVVLYIGGVGVEVNVTRSALEKCRERDITEVFLQTRLIVREDSLTLYGFSNSEERDMFDMLIKISGVGPRIAISILGTLSADNIRNAVLSDRPEILTRVPGIGKKTAQKILLELKDKIKVGMDGLPSTGVFDDVNTDVMDALVGLGFSIIEAQTAIQALPLGTPADVQERIRLSLGFLGGKSS